MSAELEALQQAPETESPPPQLSLNTTPHDALIISDAASAINQSIESGANDQSNNTTVAASTGSRLDFSFRMDRRLSRLSCHINSPYKGVLIANLRRCLSSLVCPSASGDLVIGECAICLPTIEDRTEIRPCGHSFDRKCLDQWFARLLAGRTSDVPKPLLCPLCRQPTSNLRHYTGKNYKEKYSLHFELTAKPRRHLRVKVTSPKIWGKEGDDIIQFTKGWQFRIIQQGNETVTSIKEIHGITKVDQNLLDSTPNLDESLMAGGEIPRIRRQADEYIGLFRNDPTNDGKSSGKFEYRYRIRYQKPSRAVQDIESTLRHWNILETTSGYPHDFVLTRTWELQESWRGDFPSPHRMLSRTLITRLEQI